MFAQFNVFIPVKAATVGLDLFVQPAELSVEQLFVTVMHAPCACCIIHYSHITLITLPKD